MYNEEKIASICKNYCRLSGIDPYMLVNGDMTTALTASEINEKYPDGMVPCISVPYHYWETMRPSVIAWMTIYEAATDV